MYSRPLRNNGCSRSDPLYRWRSSLPLLSTSGTRPIRELQGVRCSYLPNCQQTGKSYHAGNTSSGRSYPASRSASTFSDPGRHFHKPSIRRSEHVRCGYTCRAANCWPVSKALPISPSHKCGKPSYWYSPGAILPAGVSYHIYYTSFYPGKILPVPDSGYNRNGCRRYRIRSPTPLLKTTHSRKFQERRGLNTIRRYDACRVSAGAWQPRAFPVLSHSCPFLAGKLQTKHGIPSPVCGIRRPWKPADHIPASFHIFQRKFCLPVQ